VDRLNGENRDFDLAIGIPLGPISEAIIMVHRQLDSPEEESRMSRHSWRLDETPIVVFLCIV